MNIAVEARLLIFSLIRCHSFMINIFIHHVYTHKDGKDIRLYSDDIKIYLSLSGPEIDELGIA